MIEFKQSEFDEIRRHGEETYPHECCGVLLGIFAGEHRHVTAVVRCGNTRSDSPHNRYHIDPRELVRVQRQSREQGLDIVGFYHSHPDHPAMWSQTDLAEAHWIGCSYVITSVGSGKASQTNSFVLQGATEEHKRFEVEEIRLVTMAEEPANNGVAAAAATANDDLGPGAATGPLQE